MVGGGTMLRLPPRSPRAGSGFIASLDPDAAALIAAMSVQPNSIRKQLINNCILSIKATAGAWDLPEILYCFAAHDQQAANLNWKNPALLPAVPTNSPTWTANSGYSGDGLAAYIKTNKNANTLVGVGQNNFLLLTGVQSFGTAAAYEAGVSGGNDPSTAARFTSGLQRSKVGTTAQTSFASTDQRCLFGAQKTASGVIEDYRAGALVKTTNSGLTNEALGTTELTVLRAGSAYSAKRVPFYAAGQKGTSAQVLAILAAFKTYINAITSSGLQLS